MSLMSFPPKSNNHNMAVWMIAMMAMLWFSNPMYAQRGATFSTPIAISLSGSYAMICDTCDTRQWGGQPEAEQGMDIYYTLRLEHSANVVIHNLGSQITSTSIDIYSMIVSTPNRAVTRLQYVEWMQAAGLWNDTYGVQDIMSAVHLEAGLYRVTVCGQRMTNSGLTNGQIITTFISYTDNDFLAPFVPPFPIDGMPQRPIDIGKKKADFHVLDERPSSFYPLGPQCIGHCCYYHLSLEKRMFIHSIPTNSPILLHIRDNCGKIMGTLANANDSLDLRKGSYTLIAECIPTADKIQVLFTGRAIPAESDPKATLDEMITEPDLTSTTQGMVGSIQGTLAISPLGGATYGMAIEAPLGIGGMQPNVGIAYNSQSGLGVAGVGTSISGLSVINRAETDVSRDSTAHGLTYTDADIIYLDGRRLLCISGDKGCEGSVYAPEGDPYVHITLHGSGDTRWIEYRGHGGIVCTYGRTASSRQTGISPSGHNYIHAWYIDHTEDIHGNYTTYEYLHDNLMIYPHRIIYGRNRHHPTGLTNTIEFSYAVMNTTPRHFRLGQAVGHQLLTLSHVQTASGGHLLRSYSLTYDNHGAYPRLTSVTATNANGDALRSTVLSWDNTPKVARTVKVAALQLDDSPATVKANMFCGADLTGNGVTDIVRLTNIEYYSSIGGTEKWDNATYLYIYPAKKVGESVSYKSPLKLQLPASAAFRNFSRILGGTIPMDFNGDGYNDLIIPQTNILNNAIRKINFFTVSGYEVNRGNMEGAVFNISLQTNSNDVPCFISADIDANGRDDIVMIETGDKDRRYPLSIISCQSQIINSNLQAQLSTSWVTLPNKPTHLFVADYNNDALPDIFVCYDNGYKIFFNNGEPGQHRYDEAHSLTATDITKTLILEQGDFDGDGLIDFIYNKGGEKYYFAINQGNGTFVHNVACELDLYDQSTHNDDHRYTCIAADLDHDGLTDAIIAKAMYHKDNFSETGISWLHNTGSCLEEIRRAITPRPEDANPESLTIGNFSGIGDVEVLGYGNNIYTAGTAADSIAVRIYSTQNYTSATDRVTAITDGYGNTTHIGYATLADPTVYTQGTGATFPMSDMVLPLTVVSHTQADNGVASPISKRYHYTGLRIHRQGRGVIGYTSTQITDSLTGVVSRHEVTIWDTKHFAPSVIRETLTQGADSAVTITTMSFVDRGNNYLANTKQRQTRDMNGDQSTTTYTYDPDKDFLISEYIAYGDSNMYHHTEYSDHITVGGDWLPTRLTYSQRHPDDNVPYTDTSLLKYDIKGNLMSEIQHAGKPLSTTTIYNYDTYGNVLSFSTEGKGISTLTYYKEYDTTGRFVVKEYTNPSSTVIMRTYDQWGHVLTQTDATTTLDGPTITYTYDTWGRCQTETTPDGLTTTHTLGAATGNGEAFYTLEQREGAPWNKAVYDATGRTLRTETVGRRGMSAITTMKYNTLGDCIEYTTKSGKLKQTATYKYDIRGRVTDYSTSAGRRVSHTYARRNVSTTDGNHTYTKTKDLWGGTVMAEGEVGIVTHRYASCGSVRTSIANGSVVSSVYDGVGNQIQLTDPDAGTTTYEYDAAGRVTRQTDARGMVIQNAYDELGRLIKSDAGGITTTYIYGTSGNAIGRLVSERTDEKSICYEYDHIGRTIKETRTMKEATLVTCIIYNDLGMVAKKTIDYTPADRNVYSSHIITSYTYDPYGHMLEAWLGDSCVWRLSSVDGLTTHTDLGPTLTHTSHHDERGFLSKLTLGIGEKILNNMNFDYDGTTGNLTSRTGMTPEKEHFGYDVQDRLVLEQKGDSIKHTEYADNGNILRRTGNGAYHYDSERPHAVTDIDNENGFTPSSVQEATYNALGKVNNISDADSGYSMNIAYGPDHERWISHIYCDNILFRRTLYLGDVEVNDEYDDNGQFRSHTLFYYVGNGIIWMQRQDADGETTGRTLYAYTDNIGSVISLYDSKGNKVFAASYNAWGHQTVEHDEIGFHRGYTGHEMLPEFGVTNMNGRLYDYKLGVFLNPDGYVQDPNNDQNYNRYSYCLNNPLKYTDPSGEWFGLDDLLIASFSFITSYLATAVSTGNWGWSSVKVGITSGLTSWIGANAGGTITGNITSGTWSQVGNIAIKNCVNNLIPALNVPIGSHLGISIRPSFSMSYGYLDQGISGSLYYNSEDFSIALGSGSTNSNSGYYGLMTYKGYGIGYARTNYQEQNINGNTLGSQIVGTFTAYFPNDISFSLSNDMFGFAGKYDRWRSSAAELTIGKYSIGTYVTTNDGKGESSGHIVEKAKDKIFGINRVITDKRIVNGVEETIKRGGGWINGQVYQAPFWIGIRNNNQIQRIGMSDRTVQRLTQNFVHKYLVKTPYFLDYSNFKTGLYSYSGFANPLSLW